MKAVSIIGRAAALDDVAFRSYYEEQHVPLALRFYRFTRYRRSYVEALDGALPGFAVMPEFWSTDQARNRAIAASPDGETIRADERRFMAEPRLATSAIESALAAGDAGDRRLVLFVRAADDAHASLEGRLRAWAPALARAGTRIELDMLTPLSAAGFVADAIVSVWTAEDRRLPPPPPGVTVVGTARCLVRETPVAMLNQYAEECRP